MLHFYLSRLPGVTSVKVYDRTADAAICFEGEQDKIIEALRKFTYQDEKLEGLVPTDSGRKINREYKEKLIQKIGMRALTKLFLPFPIRAIHTTLCAAKYLYRGGGAF